ncbi:MAG TPA: hypothetical protein VFI59_11865 [Actinomycetota bacterium]|nr:hypothetical protein [Actinomycetota bacterium]
MAHRPVRRRDDVVDVRDPADASVVSSSATPTTRGPADGPVTTILVRPETIAKALLIAVVALTFAGLAARGALYLWPQEVLLHPLRVFDVGAERSIPTWFQSIALAISAFLLGTIALAVRQRGDRCALHWGSLAAIVLFLSVDEVAAMHESVGSELKYLLETTAGITPGGAISFVWVVPGVLVVAAVVVTFARFVWRLPPATRRLILIAGGLFLAGAFGLEMVSAQIVSLAGGVADWQQADGASKVAVGLLTSAEEMLEMLGEVTLVYALLHHLRDHVGAIDVGFVRSVP